MISPIAAAPLLLRWLVLPARREELLGDLEELARRRAATAAPFPATLRTWRDVVSVCVRQSRWRSRSAARFAAAAAAILALGLLPPLQPGHRVVTAVDPAGRFALAFEGSRVVAASLDGAPLAPARLLQTAGRLVIRGGGGAGRDLNIRLRPDGSFYWRSRDPAPLHLRP